MAESEQIWWIYVKLENIAEIYSAWIDFSIAQHCSELLNDDQ